MARIEIKLPKIGLVMEGARLSRWLKRPGEQVRQGEPLFELETEKSTVEVESTESGRLVELLLHEGDEAPVGAPIAWLESDAAVPETSGAAAGAEDARNSSRAADDGGIRCSSSAAGAGRVRSSPAARRLASEHALDLREISGTGPRGRVQLADVSRALQDRPPLGRALQGRPPVQAGQVQAGRAQAGRAQAQAAPLPAAAGGILSPMRRALARSMTLSNAAVPQFFVERAVDLTAVRKHRAHLLEQLPQHAVRPSLNDFLLQAIAHTLLAFPAINATFFGDPAAPDAAIVPARGAHIGLVVALDEGLQVPVLHHVERSSIAELARRRIDVVGRALQGKLRRDELEGATFSLSNLGARGPDRFTAMINPPQSAILAVGRERDCVVVRNGGLHVRPMAQLTLTVDHRIADGRLASEFLGALVVALEGDTWYLV